MTSQFLLNTFSVNHVEWKLQLTVAIHKGKSQFFNKLIQLGGFCLMFNKNYTLQLDLESFGLVLCLHMVTFLLLTACHEANNKSNKV